VIFTESGMALFKADAQDLRSGSAEPVGGVSRFQSVVNEYRTNARYRGHASLITFFSGDAFNPSLESSVTKGKHMVPFLNAIGTDVACVGVSMMTPSPREFWFKM
jgi:2',3'-cyclic-nucleotide 2'-phosphodiesterase (5'-nucleotidase family)